MDQYAPPRGAKSAGTAKDRAAHRALYAHLQDEHSHPLAGSGFSYSTAYLRQQHKRLHEYQQSRGEEQHMHGINPRAGETA